jgi:hypothetical protein
VKQLTTRLDHTGLNPHGFWQPSIATNKQAQLHAGVANVECCDAVVRLAAHFVSFGR